MASTFLYRTANNNYYAKATFSFWFKRSGLGEMGLFGRKGSNNTANLSTCHFGTNDDLLINFRDSGGTSQYYQITNRKFRDTNAWYHFHYVIEGDNSTQGDRSRLYINGVRETSFSLNNNPSSSTYEIATFLSSDGAFTLGRAVRSQTGNFTNFDGSISHFHCSTGYAYEPTVFGSTDATTGEWKIKTSPTFTPGTDGFTVLKDGNTITDQSAGSNNFDLGGGTLTKTEDNPSNVFATWNSIGANLDTTLTNGNTKVAHGSQLERRPVISALGMSSGKYYAEFKALSGSAGNIEVGIVNRSDPTTQGRYMGQALQDAGFIAYKFDGIITFDGTDTTGLTTTATNNILGVAVDIDNTKVYFYKNGVLINSGGTSFANMQGGDGDYFFCNGDRSGSSTYSLEANFGNGYFGTTAVSTAGINASGNGIFEYDVPTGYTALSTKGLNL